MMFGEPCAVPWLIDDLRLLAQVRLSAIRTKLQARPQRVKPGWRAWLRRCASAWSARKEKWHSWKTCCAQQTLSPQVSFLQPGNKERSLNGTNDAMTPNRRCCASTWSAAREKWHSSKTCCAQQTPSPQVSPSSLNPKPLPNRESEVSPEAYKMLRLRRCASAWSALKEEWHSYLLRTADSQS